MNDNHICNFNQLQFITTYTIQDHTISYRKMSQDSQLQDMQRSWRVVEAVGAVVGCGWGWGTDRQLTWSSLPCLCSASKACASRESPRTWVKKIEQAWSYMKLLFNEISELHFGSTTWDGSYIFIYGHISSMMFNAVPFISRTSIVVCLCLYNLFMFIYCPRSSLEARKCRKLGQKQ